MSIGDWVRVPSDRSRGNSRTGKIVGIYAHFVLVRFEHYQEAFRFSDVQPSK